jgi:hypothetical protein
VLVEETDGVRQLSPASDCEKGVLGRGNTSYATVSYYATMLSNKVESRQQSLS